MPQSIVSYIGLSESGHCGYCKDLKFGKKQKIGKFFLSNWGLPILKYGVAAIFESHRALYFWLNNVRILKTVIHAFLPEAAEKIGISGKESTGPTHNGCK